MPRFLPHVTPHLFHKYCDPDKNPSTILPLMGRYLDYEENEQVRRELEAIKQDAVEAHFGGTAMEPFYGQALLMERYLNDLLADESVWYGSADKWRLEDLKDTVDTARANCMTIAGFMPKRTQRTVLRLPLVDETEVEFVWEDGAVYYIGAKKAFLGTAATKQDFRTVIQRNLNYMLMHLLSDMED